MTEDEKMNDADDGMIDSVANWLMDRALGDANVENLMEGCCKRLRATGIPLWRAQIGFRTLHPLFAVHDLDLAQGRRRGHRREPSWHGGAVRQLVSQPLLPNAGQRHPLPAPASDRGRRPG